MSVNFPDLERVEMKACPRVLVVTFEEYDAATAQAITVKRLFSDWSKDSLAYVCTSPRAPQETDGVPHWRFGPKDLLPSSVRPCCRPSPPERGVSSSRDVDLAPKTSATSGLWCRLPRMMTAVSGVMELASYRPTEEFSQWLHNFNPQVIYSPLSSIRLMRLALWISTHCGVPIVPHFMDDWPTTLYRGHFLGRVLHPLGKKLLVEVLELTPISFVIGSQMGQEYQQRYGGSFIPLMNCVNVENTFSAPVSSGKVRFAYFGGLHLRRYECLADIGSAIDQLSREGVAVELRIYTHAKDVDKCMEYLPVSNAVVIATSLPASEVASEQRKMDVLIHVESFNANCQEETRLSISTKIPEYLGAGRAILAYGPSGVASMRYLAEIDCGYVVSQQGVKELCDAIRCLVLDEQRRLAMGHKAWQAAKMKHNILDQRKLFHETLIAALDMPFAKSHKKSCMEANICT